MKRFFKILKRTIVIFSILLLLLLATAVILADRLEQKIGELFVKEANTYLLTAVSVEKIGFSLISEFPMASLQLSNVYARGSLKNRANDTLLYAGQLNLNFNVLDLYRGNYTIRRIDLKNARVHLEILKDYTDNYHIIKDKEQDSDGKFSFRLQRINLNDVKIGYHNYASAQHYTLRAEKSRVKGDFDQDRYDLYANGVFRVNQIKSGDIVYLKNRQVDLELNLAVDQTTQTYTVKKGSMKAGEIQLGVEALWKSGPVTDKVNIRIKAEEASVSDFLAELPEHWRTKIENYEADGKVRLEIRLAGLVGKDNLPELNVQFSLNEGVFKHVSSGLVLNQVSLKGSFENHGSTQAGQQDVKIEAFSGMLEGNSFSGKMEILGLGPSNLNFGLDARFNAGDLVRFLDLKQFSEMDGVIQLQSMFSGQIADLSALSAHDFVNNTVNGKIKVENLNFVLQDYPKKFSGIQADLSFSNNDIIAHSLRGKVDGMDFQTDAYLRNILPYLIFNTEPLQVDARISSPSLDLYQLIAAKEAKGKESGLPMPENVGFDVRVEVDKLLFRSFNATSVDCVLKYRKKKLYVNSLSMDAFGGSLMMTGQLDAGRPERLMVDCDASLTKADIKRLFREMDNFGQEYILDQNLSGNSDAVLQLRFAMNPDLKIDPASLLASIDLNIRDGELINYKPIYGLGKFIRLDDLSRVRFSNLKNQILIKDRKIIIPEMEVQSDALNFIISGTHSFDNAIDYRIRLLLSEILSRKAKSARKENDEFGIEEEGKKGGTTLYILLTGTVDKPVFRYDSKGVKGKIISSVLNEKENLRSLFKKEFSRSKKEQDSITIREKEMNRKQESGQYIMEWDGEVLDTSARKKQSKPQVQTPKKKEKAKENQEKPVIKVDWE